MNATPLYPLPNATNIVTGFQYANSVTNDMFTSTMMFAFFIVATVGMSHAGIERSFAAGAFLTTLISYLFFVAGKYYGIDLISEYIPVLFTILTGISLIMMKR